MSKQPPQPPVAQFTLNDAGQIIQMLQNGQFGFNLRQSQELQSLIERFAQFVRQSGLQPTLPPGFVAPGTPVPAEATPAVPSENTSEEAEEASA